MLGPWIQTLNPLISNPDLFCPVPGFLPLRTTFPKRTLNGALLTPNQSAWHSKNGFGLIQVSWQSGTWGGRWWRGLLGGGICPALHHLTYQVSASFTCWSLAWLVSHPDRAFPSYFPSAPSLCSQVSVFHHPGDSALYCLGHTIASTTRTSQNYPSLVSSVYLQKKNDWKDLHCPGWLFWQFFIVHKIASLFCLTLKGVKLLWT